MPKTYLVVGASRGIGLEFVRQLLARGDQVIAAVRDPYKANELWQLSASSPRPGACVIHECDVTREDSIDVGITYYHYIGGRSECGSLSREGAIEDSQGRSDQRLGGKERSKLGKERWRQARKDQEEEEQA
jgi:short chain dehydrogenase